MEVIFNLFKIRFVKLDELITKYCTEIQQNSTINFFINIEPILKKLIMANIEDYLKVKKDERSIELMSNIFNLASHYRSFFSKNKLYSKIFIYLSYPLTNNTYKNKLIYPDYRKYYELKFNNPKLFVLKQTLTSIIPLLTIITEYIEGVYFIKSESVEGSLIPWIITNEFSDNSLNFILSNDNYDYQYTNNNFYIINPKKQNSYIIYKDNLINTLKFEDKIVNDININPKFYTFIKAILGDKYRNIQKIRNLGLITILKNLNNAIKQNILTDNTTSITILSNIIKEEHRNQLINNYYVTDLVSQYTSLNLKDIYNITEQVIDKFDNVSLKKLNDMYFTQYPIQLMDILSGVNFIKK